MATIRIFNTGRAYGPQGQRIAFEILDASRIVFSDIDREIDGYMDFQTKYGKSITEWSTSEIQSEVLKRYDAGAYRMGDLFTMRFTLRAKKQASLNRI